MSDCIFCKIIRGELPSFKIYEDERAIAFLDIKPEDWTAVAESTRALALAIEKGTEADGVNIAMNNREHAGQVVQHPHVHIIPRFKGDGIKLMPQRTYQDKEAERSE